MDIVIKVNSVKVVIVRVFVFKIGSPKRFVLAISEILKTNTFFRDPPPGPKSKGLTVVGKSFDEV